MNHAFQSYTRIVARWENMSAAQREAVINGCILQSNSSERKSIIAPDLKPGFIPVRSSYRFNPA